MQRINGLLPAKSISITMEQWELVQGEMQRLGIKTLSQYIRHLIDKERLCLQDGKEGLHKLKDYSKCPSP